MHLRITAQGKKLLLATPEPHAGLLVDALRNLQPSQLEQLARSLEFVVKQMRTTAESAAGELNTSINRAEGLGGTTNYWHNALIELDDDDLIKAGIPPRSMAEYYGKAWRFFLSPGELDQC